MSLALNVSSVWLPQVISNNLDKLNDLEQLREQIRKLDERLDSNMQVTSVFSGDPLCHPDQRLLMCGLFVQEIKREEEEWAAEIESIEKHYSLLQTKVNVGYVEAVQEMKAKQQE